MVPTESMAGPVTMFTYSRSQFPDLADELLASHRFDILIHAGLSRAGGSLPNNPASTADTSPAFPILRSATLHRTASACWSHALEAPASGKRWLGGADAQARKHGDYFGTHF